MKTKTYLTNMIALSNIKNRKKKEPEISPIGKCYYLPHHHPVIRPEKLTTKMRMIFDASSKSGGEKSLNGCL